MLEQPGEPASRGNEALRIVYVGAERGAASLAERLTDARIASERSGAGALTYLESNAVDCVVVESDLPDARGEELLSAVGELYPDAARLLVGESVHEAPADVTFVSAAPAESLPDRLARRIERTVDRHRAEREYEHFAERFSALVDGSPDAILTIDENCDVVFANAATTRVFGYEPSSLVGKSVTELLPERRRESFERKIRELRAEPGEIRRDYVELLGRHRNGREMPLAISFRETEYDGDQYFSGIVRDIGRRKRLEARLAAEKRKTAELHEVAVMLEECETAEEVYRLTVETAQQLLEFDLAAADAVVDGELVPQAVSKGVPTDGYYTTTSLDADDKLAARAFRRGESITTDDLRSENVVPAESGYRSALTVPIGEVGVLQAVSKEVGAFDQSDRELAELLVAHVAQALERIRSEEALQAERDRFAALFENVPEPTVDYEIRNGEPIVRTVNEAFEEVFGYDAAEAVGANLDDLIVSDSHREDAEGLNERVQRGERVDAEVHREAADGERVFLLRNAEVPGDAGNYVIYTDITERKESEERHRTMTEDVLDNTDVGIFILDDAFDVAWVNSTVEEYFGLERESVLDRDKRALIEERIRRGVEDPETFVDTITATYDDNTYAEEFVCHVLEGDGREERYLQHVSQPIESGLYEGGRVELYYDVTEQVQREEMLDALHGATRDLMVAESEEEISETVIETARDVLDMPLASVFRWDDDEEHLSNFVTTDTDPRTVEKVPTFERGKGVVGTAFDRGEDVVLADAQESPDKHPEGSDVIRGFCVFPLGDWGAIAVSSLEADAFDEYEVDLMRVLAANTEVALERAAREAELADQRERLAELDRINAVIRDIDQLLVRAATREEIEQAVCERLADSEHYRFAWTGASRSGSTDLQRTASAGFEDGYLDAADERYDRSSPSPPAKAVETGEVQVVENFCEDPTVEGWRDEALERGYRSEVAIPLRYRKTVYGALSVYADRQGAFDDRETAVLAELGETIGHAINAVENKKALLSDGVVEVEFEADRGEGFFVRVPQEEGATFTLEGVTIGSSESFIYFVTVEGLDPERVEELAADDPDVERARLVNEHDDGDLFEFVYTGPSPLSALADHGGTLREATFDENGARSVGEVPRNVDVRTVVEAVQDTYPTVEVVAQRERERPAKTVQEFRAGLEDDLTERQRSALETAYYAGFFEWPRESSGEEVADTLGVSAPTFHQHLRVGERKLLTAFLDD
ncbi:MULTISPECIES: GAF domain-containing protein [Halorussus]|uniref:GAF domain-containing protein n=1 Tax=Halorussus TaxID=1070314 RepID=UPI00209D134F|nr:GAF domain-containing protein [Halorussus vallis]USZ78193.1 GAF domain-containing protein [Halorussus vallis]